MHKKVFLLFAHCIILLFQAALFSLHAEDHLSVSEKLAVIKKLEKSQKNLPHIIARKASAYRLEMKKGDFNFWLERYVKSLSTNLYADIWRAYHLSYSPTKRQYILAVCKHNLHNLQLHKKIFLVLSYHIKKNLQANGNEHDIQAFNNFERCQKNQLQQTQKMIKKIMQKLKKKKI